MAQSKRAQNSDLNSAKKRPPPESIAKFCFKPGVSGNPGGRPRRRPLTDMMIEFLTQIDPKDKHKRQFAQKIIRAWYDRAVSTSDVLLIEMLDRVEGRVAPQSAEERQADVQPVIVIMDLPRPPGTLWIPSLAEGKGKPRPDPKE
jgi:hypothetical protein